MAEPNPNPDPKPEPDINAEVERWKAEAKKAFQDRDSVKAKLRELEGKTLSDEDRALFDTLKQQQEQAEEDRKKKAGEFDAWRQQIADKHTKELEAERKKIAAETEAKGKAVRDLHDTLIGLSFAGASEWFGDNGKTVLPPAIAQSHLGRYVEVQIDDASGARTVVVKDVHGNPILDTKTGKPLAFDKAIGELIDALPEKDRILKGSGKSGSGSGGGAGGGVYERDLTNLRSADFEDPKVREAVRNKLATSGGLRIGPAFDRMKKPA
jgi:uncharacterized protein DUF6651